MGNRLCAVICFMMITAFLFAIDNGYSQNAKVEEGASGISVDLLQSNESQANMTGNGTDSTGIITPQGNPTDFPTDVPFNAKKIAMDLTKLTPTEISHYPITNLSPEDIESAFELLNPSNIAKVLLNIRQADLVEVVENKLNPTTFNQTLSRLPEANRTQVEERLYDLIASKR
jgi:hypothetical protein